MADGVVHREEVEALLWDVADTLTLVRDIHSLLFEDGDEEEEEGNT